jgi:hypothetical protein
MRCFTSICALLLIAFSSAACGGSEDSRAGAPAVSQTASPTVSATPAASSRTAIYLSIGDSIQYGCCHDPKQSAGELFRAYLEQRLRRPVEWVTVANDDTADTFIHGMNGAEPQMQRAVDVLSSARRDGRPVVAITMSIGGNDYVEVGARCANPPCVQLFNEILDRMRRQLPLIYRTINDAKDPRTPLFLLTYYNASDCGQPGVEGSPTDAGQRVWNATIAEAARPFGFFMVDLYAPFKGKACEYIEGVDPTYAGYRVIAGLYRAAYESLPASLVDPFAGGR